MNALIQLINTVSRYLQGEHIPHVLVGGVAVAIWGRPRATEDVDLIVDLQPEHLEPLHGHLAEHGIKMDADAARRALSDGRSFPLADAWSIHWVDVRTPSRPIDRVALERAQRVEIAEEPVPVASPEDVILGKLLTGRHQDLLDAKSIVLRRGERLDRAYVTNRARELRLDERWRQVAGSPASTGD